MSEYSNRNSSRTTSSTAPASTTTSPALSNPSQKAIQPTQQSSLGHPEPGRPALLSTPSTNSARTSSTSTLSKSTAGKTTASSKTLYRILEGLDQTLDIHRQSTPTDELFERLQDYDGPPYVVTLDKADQLEDTDVLYELYRTPTVTMVLIATFWITV